MKLNPEGTHVPVLVDGNKVISKPEEIINHIDKIGSGEIFIIVVFCSNVDLPILVYRNIIKSFSSTN